MGRDTQLVGVGDSGQVQAGGTPNKRKTKAGEQLNESVLDDHLALMAAQESKKRVRRQDGGGVLSDGSFIVIGGRGGELAVCLRARCAMHGTDVSCDARRLAQPDQPCVLL